VDRAELTDRLEPFLLRRLDPRARSFPLRSFRPALTPNRLDLATKVALLDSIAGPPATFPARLYDAHIAAFSLGEMTEPGAPAKQGAQAFRTAFLNLRNSLADTGFDPRTSLIPLASDGTILNGAHRVACALHLGLPLVGVETGLEPVCYDGAWFRDRGMPDTDLNAMALAHVERAPDAAIALLWPAAPMLNAASEALLGPVVHSRAIHLNTRGAHNLLSQVYDGEPWLGPAGQDFPGIAAKLAPCFASNRPLRVLLLDLPPQTDRVALKAKVRAPWGLGKHSIHITDTWPEAVRLARLLFNDQGLHFLTHAAPNRFPEVADMVRRFRTEMARHGADPDQTALDTGMVLGAYGLRMPGDVDFGSVEPVTLPPPFERHEPAPPGPGLGDILTDPTLHFHFWDQRFVALPVVADTKLRRQAGRDHEDLVQIAALLSDRRSPGYAGRAAGLRLARARLRHRAITVLQALGLKDVARRIYWWLRSRR
jgi:hypothetical protein